MHAYDYADCVKLYVHIVMMQQHNKLYLAIWQMHLLGSVVTLHGL